MAHVGVFDEDHASESACYFCQVVTDGWQLNGDVQQLVSALYVMAWAVDRLPKDSKVRQRLRTQCTSIACYLLDKKTKAVLNETK
jgi:hypothetical protein